ncbi:MAG TPA: hypothetical protein VEK34_05730 [Methylocella sp.]|nr:hypothetical protein [Methylocella sp.]
MDTKTAGLVRAISTLITVTGLQTAAAQEVTNVLSPKSYAELLQPIPNAVALLTAADAIAGQNASHNPDIQTVQYGYHHHHHHRWWRRHRHHHHHHHHHYY